MKLGDVADRLVAELPRWTNRFSNAALTVSSLTRSGNTVTVVTNQAHDLSTGDYVLITGAEAPIEVSSLSHDGMGNAAVETTIEHELTEDYPPFDKIKITGADQSEWNDTFNIKNVPTFKIAEFEVDPGFTQTATGNILLFDGKERGYNGEKQVTVVDSTTFTYQISGSTPAAQGNIIAHTGVNVATSLDASYFMEHLYETNDTAQVWALVVMGDSTVSTSRDLDNDSAQIFQPMTEFYIKSAHEFAVYLIIRTDDELTGTAARDLVEDLKRPLYKSLIGHRFDNYLESPAQYATVLKSHGSFQWNRAFYVHEFIFEQTDEIARCDTAEPEQTVAFKNICLRLQNQFGTVIMSTDVNLEEDLDR